MMTDRNAMKPCRKRGSMLRAFLADESGTTAIEYALIAAGIFLAIVTVISQVGSAVNNLFTEVNDAV